MTIPQGAQAEDAVQQAEGGFASEGIDESVIEVAPNASEEGQPPKGGCEEGG